jgi:FKBP-type peptidyl-prolyl cis-trans isomerase FkpA
MYGRRAFLWTTVAAVLATTACSSDSNDSPTAPTPPPPTGPADLVITEMVVGEGTEATSTSSVFLHYTLWHYDPAGTDQKGAQIETSRAGSPVPFTLGPNLIPGFVQGVTGMRVGGQRRFIVPPNLAYGASGNGPIRPNEWIVFEVELLSVT